MTAFTTYSTGEGVGSRTGLEVAPTREIHFLACHYSISNSDLTKL
jgi:hypothetical protein